LDAVKISFLFEKHHSLSHKNRHAAHIIPVNLLKLPWEPRYKEYNTSLLTRSQIENIQGRCKMLLDPLNQLTAPATQSITQNTPNVEA